MMERISGSRTTALCDGLELSLFWCRVSDSESVWTGAYSEGRMLRREEGWEFARDECCVKTNG